MLAYISNFFEQQNKQTNKQANLETNTQPRIGG
jgi:hypothetical protein